MQDGLKRILYVEDDPVIYELGIMVLEELGGFTVQHCSSGPQALSKAADFRPDMLVLDVMMPEMDGLETLQRLRRIGPCAETPAVFISARAQADERAAYFAAGACGVIPKPFDPIALPDRLREIWAAARGKQ